MSQHWHPPGRRNRLRGLALATLLALAGPTLAGDPRHAATADAAVQEARRAARADRHGPAIDAFDRALRAAPERRREWLLEYADLHTWAGRLETAIALYREAIGALDGAGRQRARVGLARALSWAGRHDEALAEYTRALAVDPRDREARLGRAQVLSWADRHAEALGAYEAILADHPGDHDALRGRGRVLSWSGRHREAAALMQAFLQQRPHDRDATQVLAESLEWMGRGDRALPLLRSQRAADAQDARSAALLQRLEQARRPELAIDRREFDQSDDLAIAETAAALGLSVGEGRGLLRPRIASARFRPPVGPVERIDVDRVGIDTRWRFGDDLEWNGTFWRERIDTRGAQGDHRRWTHDIYLTWWPGDAWRVDLSSARWTFDSEDALRAGLTAHQLKLSGDWRPDALTRLTARASRADFADGNRREGLQLEAERRVWHRPRVHAGLRHTALDFTLPGQRGYYNPDRVHSTELTLHAQGRLAAALAWDVRGAYGRESERGAAARPIRSGSVALSWQAGPDLVLEAAYDHATSRTLDSGGFARGIARLTLRSRF